MTMIDRESAQKVIAVLDDIQRDGDDDGARAMMVLSALEEVLAQGLAGNNTAEDAGPLSEGASLRDKFVRFFGITVQVAAKPPLPYSVAEVAILARFSQQRYMGKAKAEWAREDISEIESVEMGEFYEDVANTYGFLAQFAEQNDMKKAIFQFNCMDTADRENFGQGAAIWDEGRWEVTRRDFG